MWTLRVTKKAERFLNKLDAKIKSRIKQKLQLLENFPDSQIDIKKIVNEENTFRLRIGKYRAIFVIIPAEKEIIIDNINVRGEIYKNL